MPTVKACTKCGEVKPLDGFHKNKDGKYGVASRCKECKAEHHRRYYAENRESILEQDRRYREENREKERERSRRYRDENLDKVRERQRRYREKNREKERERNRRYYEGNREIINAKNSSLYATAQELAKALSNVQPYVRWSEEEDAFLMEDNGMTAYQKATHLGRTYSSCVSRIQTLKNLRRTTNA